MRSGRLRVGIIAPPWVPVPPPSYGGTELVLDVLARGLVDQGHDVVLYTTGDATCDVPRRWLFDRCDPDRMGASVLELRHAAAAYEALAGCDIIHDHTLSGLFVSELYPESTVVTTNHGPFNEDLVDIYAKVAHRIPVIGISHHQASTAPPGLPVATVIHHGLDLDRYPFDPNGGDYLFNLSRMSADKGIDRAIGIARRAGLPLLIAAKMREPAERRYFTEVIEPLLGGDIVYIGEVDHARKVALLRGAKALLNPIRWPEPFGLVMIEALSCGTPVVATYEGAAPEIVVDGVSGFLSDDDDVLVEAAGKLDSIDRATCRREAEEKFSAQRMVADHARFFHQVLNRRSLRASVPWRQPRWIETAVGRPSIATAVPSIRTSIRPSPSGTPSAFSRRSPPLTAG